MWVHVVALQTGPVRCPCTARTPTLSQASRPCLYLHPSSAAAAAAPPVQAMQEKMVPPRPPPLQVHLEAEMTEGL